MSERYRDEGTVDVQEYDCYQDGCEHGFCAEGESLLDPPETVDADCLRGNADEEEVCKGQSVVFDDCVLECGDYGYGCVEGVAEEEVTWEIL